MGPLGCLHLPQIDAADLGFQDQAAVLRWVQDNISSFGGDPRTVTVGGQSAGAYSALMLALDPATNGSITRVLLQSGSAAGLQHLQGPGLGVVAAQGGEPG
ncbi:carboxylesterase family protein [Streptomyces sp. NPDC051133]|uniref:carboxylesterase family protein n=1 Tax=Streptomyces sp. NPDC051133 TaxID=3155521 RepID=UPI00342CB162